jgi:hypothetical protein
VNSRKPQLGFDSSLLLSTEKVIASISSSVI